MKTFVAKHLSVLTRAFCASLALVALALPSRAASITYTFTDGNSTDDFNDAANWSPSSGSAVAPGTIVVPGTTTSFTNSNIALFDGSAGVGTVIDTGINRNLQEIEFINDATSDLGSYTIGSSADTLYFTNGGVNILASFTGSGNVASATQTIASNIMATHSTSTLTQGNTGNNDDLEIEMTGQTSNPANGDPINGNSGFDGTLSITGNISTVATSGNSNIIFTGTTGASNSTEDPNDIIAVSGVISDGANATVSVDHRNYDTVIFSGANTYSGGFTQGIVNSSSDNTSDMTEIGVNSVGTVGNIVSSAFGTGAINFFDGEISSDGTTARTILNNVNFGFSDFRDAVSDRGTALGNATKSGTLTLAGNVTLPTSGAANDTFVFGTIPSGSTTELDTLSTGPLTLGINSNVIITGQVSGSQDEGSVAAADGTPDATGTGGFTKVGSGTLVLADAAGNTYHGVTTVSAGALIVSNTSGSATGDGALNVNSGGTLGGSGIITPSKVTSTSASTVAVNFASGSTLNPSATPVLNAVGDVANTAQTAFNTLNFSLSSGTTVNFALGTKFVFDLGAVGASDEVIVTGGSAQFNSQVWSNFTFNAEAGFGAGTYDLVDSSDAGVIGSLGATTTGTLDGGLFNGTISLTNGDLVLTVAAVPEPSVWAMLLSGFGLLIAIQAYRKKANQI